MKLRWTPDPAGGTLKLSSSELDLDRPNIEDYLPSGSSIHEPRGKLRLRDLLDCSPTLSEAAGAIVDDSFTRCFKSNPPEKWNWNIYLFPLWCCGVLVRYLILFPARLAVVAGALFSFAWSLGAFELGCTVCPIAIKYNKIFVDAFWNSRKQSFSMHLLQLMTSWAVVCNVWYLEPQRIRPGETAIEFAERVRDIISVRAGLQKVPWDGYLKYSRPSPKHRERKQQSLAESVLHWLEEK
ncbi:hypothetical protein MLD38_023093 [Melastoma candidum]|uniref:Uncharacterized protein n=1 Tax=Melastoma candidum TaxID=119954 RepID=A0ACB9QLF4_9MYRT|nr:hypothetical protein MLD38_023093 [Melastoma candidum]